jgi:hypothetical protein
MCVRGSPAAAAAGSQIQNVRIVSSLFMFAPSLAIADR